MFSFEIHFHNCTPEEVIRQLRAKGLSLEEVARQAGSTVSVVRRLVGKLDQAEIRHQQDEIARQIDADPLPWPEKVAIWTERTGKGEATFRRVLKRCAASS